MGIGKGFGPVLFDLSYGWVLWVRSGQKLSISDFSMGFGKGFSRKMSKNHYFHCFSLIFEVLPDFHRPWGLDRVLETKWPEIQQKVVILDTQKPPLLDISQKHHF